MPQLVTGCNLKGQICQAGRKRVKNVNKEAKPNREDFVLNYAGMRRKLWILKKAEPAGTGSCKSRQEPAGTGTCTKHTGTGRNRNLLATNRMDHKMDSRNFGSPEYSI